MPEYALARELEDILNPGDVLHLQPTERVYRAIFYKDEEFDCIFHGRRFLQSYRTFSVVCVPRYPSGAPPPVAPPSGEDDGPHGAKAKAVKAALDALWPGWPRSIPGELAAKERDIRIDNWINDQGYSRIADIGRAVRRVLQEARGA